MIRWALLLTVAVAATACGGNRESNSLAPSRAGSPAVLDSLWRDAVQLVRHGKWNKAQKQLERVILQLSPEDSELPRARYYLGEAHLGQGNRLEAAREFRKAVDDAPDSPIAAEALLRLGDAYAEMWRRPELDPTHGENAILAYQELLARYPNTAAAERAKPKIAELNERFAYKAYRAGMYYFRLKAYDSAILYFTDLIATYSRTAIVPEALTRLIYAYEKLGYREDVTEKCEYARKWHRDVPSLMALCPAAVPPAAPPDTAAAPTPTP